MPLTPAPVTLRLRMLAADRSREACFIIDEESRVMYANKAARTIFHRDEEEGAPTLGEFLGALVNRDGLIQLVARGKAGTSTTEQTSLFIGAREYMGQLRVLAVVHGDPAHTPAGHVVVYFQDQSNYVRLQRRLTQDEFYDRPTGLLNRKTLEIILELELDKAQRDPEGTRLALLMVDIRNIEHLKARYNSTVYNHILEHIGLCIRGALRSNDLVFRYDEHRILSIVNDFKLESDLLIIAERIDDQIGIPYHTQDATIHLQATMGISVFPSDGTTYDALIGNASNALEHAIEESVPWLMNNPKVHQRSMDRLYLRSGLSQAVRNNELQLQYMNLVDPSGRTRGVEALVRWNHPERGILGPDQFLPVALHSRSMGAITRWVLFKLVQDWEDHLKPHGLFISMNLSAQDLADSYLLDAMATALQDTMPPSMLKVEITENEVMADPETSLKTMGDLGRQGIQIMIDDFGVGYSSLAWLKDFPIQWAKIDRSFVSSITHSDQELEFMKHIIALARVRGLQVLVEGVETAEQYRMLRMTGASLFQGFYFGEAMDLPLLVSCLDGEDWVARSREAP